eukprot:347985-Hanusia_phi.AAC.1
MTGIHEVFTDILLQEVRRNHETIDMCNRTGCLPIFPSILNTVPGSGAGGTGAGAGGVAGVVVTAASSVGVGVIGGASA